MLAYNHNKYLYLPAVLLAGNIQIKYCLSKIIRMQRKEAFSKDQKCEITGDERHK